jgi:DNA repair protein SbcC/Rad50
MWRMRLDSLELKNIRSYRSTRIEFPDGIILLSGDIGAGKSTLLLAIEFALFGLSRGELVGSALLRHGAVDGMITLEFSVQKMRYRITRTLKRTAQSVSQDTGWLEVNGTREILTPSELRAKVYEILGYPLQFLSKQRNLLYRFTLYTPQEEMKAILSQASEERLETIRRIFGIDAYRIARDNAHLLAKALKDRENVGESILPRLQQEHDRLHQKITRAAEVHEQKTQLLLQRTKLQSELQVHEQQVNLLDAERQGVQAQQQAAIMQERNRKIAEQEFRQLQLQAERKEHLMRDTQDLAKKLSVTLALFTGEMQGSADMQTLQQELQSATDALEKLRQDEGKTLGLLEQCNHPLTLSAGASCPTCKQLVSAHHVDEINNALFAQAKAAKAKHETLQKKIVAQRLLISTLQGQVEKLRQIEDVHKQLALQEKLLMQQQEEQKLLQQSLSAKQAIVQQIIPQDGKLVERNKLLEQQILEAKGMMQRLRQHLLDVEKSLGRIEQEEKELQEARERLTLLSREKLQTQERLDRDARMRNWITRQFSPFSATVERHVLMSIHASFDAVFRQWFSRLIEDDGLSTRIDHEFAPVMLQYGYETDVAFLSGGERTAVSLAYRLAFVHTIHVLLPHLGTLGLLMLDEPTDGFSSEQLERVRDVLRELRMHQIILVSHEQQLEGFVDHILRVRKTGDGSVIEVTA